jgi:hypothetical protein
MKTQLKLQHCKTLNTALLTFWLLNLVLLSAPATSLAQAFDAAALAQSLRGTDRDISDRMRDADRKPVEVLQFLGLEQGMTVLDDMQPVAITPL